jgi:hypothetical protein
MELACRVSEQWSLVIGAERRVVLRLWLAERQAILR